MRVTIESKNHKYQNTYGGEIYQYDFCTDYGYTKNMANRIAEAIRFDKQHNTIYRKNNKGVY